MRDPDPDFDLSKDLPSRDPDPDPDPDPDLSKDLRKDPLWDPKAAAVVPSLVILCSSSVSSSSLFLAKPQFRSSTLLALFYRVIGEELC